MIATNGSGIFDVRLPLPDSSLSLKARTLLGFDDRYQKVHEHLRLLLNLDALDEWSNKFHRQRIELCGLISEQYPLVIFYGDVGTGKTATAECVANELARESKSEDSILFKLSNRVRGSGKVGEMGTLITQAIQEVVQSAGKNRRAFLIIDEGDSLAASRSQEHSHHEDKVAVNTLIQAVDDLRRYKGRVVIILCTNRLSVLDPALQRRAAIVEEFRRPNDGERKMLFKMDLKGLNLNDSQIDELVTLTGPRPGQPGFTFSDIRTRIYPKVVCRAFPSRGVTFADFKDAVISLVPSPVMEDK
jgi:SpoVK/Ycf46/Vps4 family AAA+-type ATPase